MIAQHLVQLAGPVQNLFYPHQKLQHRKRLNDVIFSADLQPLYARRHIRFGSQVYYGDIVFLHMLHQRKAIEPGQHNIKQRQIERMILAQALRRFKSIVYYRVIISR